VAEIVEPGLVEIDGRHGEGGGQILRTSLALSAITGTPVRFTHIRAGRKKPGLQRQHLACVKAAAAICGADVKGAELHASTVSFVPGPLTGGDFHFEIGTAGSTGLVLQTVIPALLAAPAPAHVVVDGGTHNPMSPPFDFLARAFAPQLERMGAHVRLRLASYGFAPAGGGRVVCDVSPGRLHPIVIGAAGPVIRRKAQAILSRLPTHVGRRELDVVKERLGWSDDELEILDVATPGMGNALLLEIERAAADAGAPPVTEVVVGFGEKGTRAEKVAGDAVDELGRLLASDALVGEHLADQLLLPMALAGGGRFRTLAPSLHTTTNIDVIGRFLNVPFTITPVAGGAEITVGAS
jgi:RNA 3'-terminal phosphate cyclase (ATP)